MKFYEKLQMLRKEKGISQEGLAEQLGVSRQAISKWESGAAYPETEKMIALCDIFGVTLDGLIRDGDLYSNSSAQPAPIYARREYGYEYKSKRMLFGLPLVHINISKGRPLARAKGIIAFGNIATGVVSFGMVSSGIVSFGTVSAGLISFGAASLGLLFSMGAFSVGAVSFGAIAVGLAAVGAVSVGMYSAGAVAVASRVAVGDHANGVIAVGRVVNGVIEFVDTSAARDFSAVSAEEVRRAILAEYPNTWQWIVRLMTFWGR